MHKWHQPDFTADCLEMTNTYRMGDSIAVVELREWVEKHYGPKQWSANLKSIGMLTLLGGHVNPGGQAWGLCGDDEAEPFDDVNLWLWNDFFHETDHRVEFARRSVEAPPIIFAPLLEAGYSVERTLHIKCAVEMCEWLHEHHPDARCLLPPDANRVDQALIEDTGIGVLQVPDLAPLISVIGNTKLWIGCDTGLSHIAACYPDVHQIALHDRLNTERHNELEFDHQSKGRERVRAMIGDKHTWTDEHSPRYRSVPNKSDEMLTTHLFDHRGCDGVTVEWVKELVNGVMEKV